MKLIKPYRLTGTIERIDDGYIVLKDERGSKYRLCFPERMRHFFREGFKIGVQCKTCHTTKLRVVLSVHKTAAINEIKKKNSRRARAFADHNLVISEGEANKIGVKSHYNGSMPAIKGKKPKAYKDREKALANLAGNFEKQTRFRQGHEKISKSTDEHIKRLNEQESAAAFRRWKEQQATSN